MFKADFVLVFDTSLREQEIMPQEYLQLVNSLKEAGLVVTARSGVKDSNTILVLVRATNGRLLREIEAQARLDFVKGVHSPRANMQLETAADRPVPLTPAERLYYVDQIITTSQDKSTEAIKYAGVSVGNKPFPRVKDIFAPHDTQFNNEWLPSWSKDMSLMDLKLKELDQVAAHFGVNVAMYFAFLRSYFAALVPPSVVGFMTWAAGGSFSPLYSFAIVLWSVLFVEWWRIRERILAVRWGTYNASLATPRAQFKGIVDKIDPITGEQKKSQPWHVTELRQLFSVPILLGAAAVLIFCICGIFTTEVLLTEVYTGPGQAVLKYLPIVLFAGIVPQVINAWYNLAQRLTDYENHEQEAHHERSLSLKMFALNAISGYGSLVLSAYVYIPFGTYLVPRIVKVFDKNSVRQAYHAGKYSINASRLVNTLFALNTTTQVIGNVNEAITPFVLRRLYPKLKEQKQENKKTDSESSEEDVYIRQVQKEAGLPQYDLFGDYSEMALQFGHVVLWSTCWTLVPLTSLINNFFELRTDAFKICENERRPIPKRSGSIGPWLEVLSFMTWLAAFTNASLTYLYKHSHTMEQTDEGQAAMHNTTSAATRMAAASRIPEASVETIRNALFTAFLVGLGCEHGYVAIRAAVRHVMTKLLWEESDEAVAIARQEYELRKQAMGKLDASAGGHRISSAAEESSPFWQVDPMDELQRVVKKD